MDEGDELIGTSTVRGVLLLVGVGTVAYLAYRYWQQLKMNEPHLPPHTISIPVGSPKKVPVPKSNARAFHGFEAWECY